MVREILVKLEMATLVGMSKNGLQQDGSCVCSPSQCVNRILIKCTMFNHNEESRAVMAVLT